MSSSSAIQKKTWKLNIKAVAATVNIHEQGKLLQAKLFFKCSKIKSYLQFFINIDFLDISPPNCQEMASKWWQPQPKTLHKSTQQCTDRGIPQLVTFPLSETYIYVCVRERVISSRGTCSKKEVVKWKFYVMSNAFLYQDRKKRRKYCCTHSIQCCRRKN